MDMRARVNTALKQAMKDKSADRLATLRLICAAIKDREIAQRGDGEDNAVGDAMLVYFAAGERPVVARAADAAIDGKVPSEETFEAAAAALDQDLNPPADLNADPATRLHLARVLTRRALAQWAE